MAKEEKSASFSISVRLGKAIGFVGPNNDSSTININRKIAEAINRAMGKLSNWTDDFKGLVQNGKHRDAYDSFVENMATLKYSKASILDYVLMIDKNVLTREEQRNLTLKII